MNVILQGEGRPFGVLEVDSRSQDEFTPQDISFLQGAANILGMAIERERHEQSLRAALERQQLLLKEIMHRVKNSLGIVASMLKLQAADVNNAEMTRHLEEAAYRVSAVAKAHERIYQGNDTDKLDLGVYLEQVCLDLDDAVAICDIKVNAEHGIDIMTDRAIPIALITNELVTNAAKHAHKDGAKGTINVRLGRRGDMIELSIEDRGVGLPSDFNMQTAKGLGMRIVQALSKQLGANITVHRLDPGTSFLLTIPLQPRHTSAAV
jgi:two-component sensor histidine kinase